MQKVMYVNAIMIENMWVYIYSISQKWVHPSHFCKYLIISFHVTTEKLHFATM